MSKWEILDVRESDIGIYVTVETDYGLKTTKNFNKNISEDGIEQSIDNWYNQNKPVGEESVDVKKSDKFSKIKKGYKKPE